MEFLFADWLGTPVWFWLAFIAIVIALTAFDLGILHRESREMGIGESLRLSALYIGIALAFGGWIWAAKGGEAGLQYYTGFFIEKALSIDNIFVISLIFATFAIPPRYQYRALLWGIIAVIVLRGIMIAGGSALVTEYGWLLYVFAAFLVFTGIKMLFASEKPMDVAGNPVVRWLSRHIPITQELHGEKFFVRVPDTRTGKLALAATPLFLALVVINLADLVFAVDSVPAIFAITQDPFIIYTSNIFAILGLRSLYFALSAAMNKFRYLSYALAFVLVFIGVKIFLVPLHIHIPTLLSLGVTLGALAAGVAYSLWRTRNEPPKSAEDDPESGHLVP